MSIYNSLVEIKNKILINLDILIFKLNTPQYLPAPGEDELDIDLESVDFVPSELLTLLLIIFISLKIFVNKNLINTKKIILFLLLFYAFLKLLISYNSFLDLNQDSVAWIITSIRMDMLGTFEYLASWDHKGSIIYWIYLLVYKYFKISNSLWINYSLFFILWSGLISYLSFKYLNKNNVNKYTALVISLLMFLNLTFSPGEGYPVFDSRFVGSSFILIGIYYLAEEKYILSSIFLALSILTLPTFVFAVIAIFLITIYKNFKSKKNRVIEIFLSYLFVFFGYFFYLLITSQLDEFLRLVIKFNLNLSGVGTYYPLTYVLQSNLYLFFFFSLSVLYFKKLHHKFGENYLVIMVWCICAIFHLVFTGPRFYQYEQLITIPLSLVGFFSLYIIYDLLKKIQNSNAVIKIFIIIFVSTPLSILSYSLTTSLEINTLEISEVRNKVLEVIYFEGNSVIYEKEPDFAIFFVDGKDWQEVITNYNFLPSTRFWQLFWNQRDSGWAQDFNWGEIVTDEEYKSFLMNDLRIEKPKYAVVDTEYKSSYKNLLYDYIIYNYNLDNCTENYCLYSKK